MNKIKINQIRFILVWMVTIWAFPTNSYAGVPPIYYQIELNENSHYYTVQAEGTPFERGFTHGKKLKKEIRYAINRFKYDLTVPMMQSVGLPAEYHRYHNYVLQNTGFIEAIKTQTPDLLEELEGIAKGAEVNLEDLLVYNISFDEIFAVLEKMTGHNPAFIEGNDLNGHCSFGSIRGKKRTTSIYTCDWARPFEGSQCLMVYKKFDGTTMLITGYVGTVGIQGVNLSNGFSVNAHSKFDLNANLNGLPSLFFARRLMEAKDKHDAVVKLSETKIAVGLGYVITDKNGSVSYEVSPNQTEKYNPGSHWFAIANAARVNNDLKASVKEHFKLDEQVNMKRLPKGYWEHNADSETRYSMIKEELTDKKWMTVYEWVNLFKQYPIGKYVDENQATTNFWIIVEFSDKYIDICTAPGVPGELQAETIRVKYQ
ncbi:C45 family autoproteolytic acyltransferase/hydolase [Flammeovirga agarivorans]|uniref:Acyl-coenzyme A:6-aminopenicillanic acid acyl-transferase n=1 Tax=Flammeovirga agarivorans TaxID=2726742 RepID=A0A7X8SPC7_9BACT|nr:C45 family peptidase [Flammeovirga agarivorans]NLR93850.1 hypothetical protein [Flammeovirga agarivorans]